MSTITFTKDISVRADYDCIVCGGGCAGFVAAISAARAGLRTALVERYGFLGGTATAGYVVPISGFYYKENEKEYEISLYLKSTTEIGIGV